MEAKTYSEPLTKSVVAHAAQELARKAYKLLNKAVQFHDTYVNICTTPGSQTSPGQAEPISGDTLG